MPIIQNESNENIISIPKEALEKLFAAYIKLDGQYAALDYHLTRDEYQHILAIVEP